MQERKVSPPNLPPKDFFIPLGALLYAVRRGQRLSVITVADIQAKRLPEDLQKLKDGATKALIGDAATTPRSAPAAKDGSRRPASGEDISASAGDEGVKPMVEATPMSTSRIESGASIGAAVFGSAIKALLEEEDAQEKKEANGNGRE
jgi:hypothetical protein